jgi:hypoxia up-regulated 1
MSTTASVVAFYQTSWLPTPKSKTPINTTHIELIGTGWQQVGGVMLDLTIQEVLVADFIQKTGKVAIREDKRAMAKLLKEAVRVKHILSANHESGVNVSYLLPRSRGKLIHRSNLSTKTSTTRPNSAEPS